MSSPPDLRGIFPPLTTPFAADGMLDPGGLERNLTRYAESDLAGYVAFGSNGEAVHLTATERRKVLEIIRTAGGPGKTLIAGVNALSTAGAIAETRAVAASGAEVALVITPYFYKGSMDAEALERFFTEVADASPIPVLVYNVPQNTGVVISPRSLGVLSGHPNIVGVKDSSGNLSALGDTLRRVPEGFAVLVGNAGILYPALALGAVGGILAVACVLPEVCTRLRAAVLAGDHEEARRLHQLQAPIAHKVTAEHGIAGLKTALELLGLTGGDPRRPLLPLSEAGRKDLEQALAAGGLLPGGSSASR